MRILVMLIVALAQLGVVGKWLVAFAGEIGGPHQAAYFFIPMIFLLVPSAVVASIIFRRSRSSALSKSVLAWTLTILNFVGFLMYALMSGGGM